MIGVGLWNPFGHVTADSVLASVGGTYHVVVAADVRDGEVFGPNNTLIGTYSSGGTYAEGRADQQAADVAEVTAVRTSILNTVTGLLGSIAGTLDLSPYAARTTDVCPPTAIVSPVSTLANAGEFGTPASGDSAATLAAYQARTVDVLAFSGARAAGETLLAQTLAAAGRGGQVVTGVHKLAQRFLLELLTETDSILYWPGRGTDFMTEVRQGYVRTQLDMFGAFARALETINITLPAEESDSDPSDERYGGADILSVTVSGDTASISVRVWSYAGTDRAVILPVSLAI